MAKSSKKPTVIIGVTNEFTAESLGQEIVDSIYDKTFDEAREGDAKRFSEELVIKLLENHREAFGADDKFNKKVAEQLGIKIAK